MAIPSQRKYDAAHAANIEKYGRLIRKYYREVIKEVSKLAVGLQLNANDQFYFRNNPQLSKKVNKLLKSLYSQVYGTSVSGINSEWELAVEKNNELARYVYGKNLDNLPIQYRDKYFSNNGAARRAFVYRKDSFGLGLSDKVWKNTRQFKSNLELALEVSIGKGESAASIAQNVTKYLNDEDKLFRRVREHPDGALRLSKSAKVYHPGQGRYRSSYKNALRLASNETNFSYESSQQEKRKQQDFIVGIEIRVSPRHNISDDKGGIQCYYLQGKYPKDFDWTYKWHVNCRCYSINILKPREELDTDINRILSGKKPIKSSKNQVSKKPKNYTGYIKDNKKKWENWKNKPRTFESNTE